MKTPDGSIGEVLQANCTGVHAILVDERSLIGSTTLGWMDFHCRCGTGFADQSWGGIPVVVFFGDDVQLPPVLDAPRLCMASLLLGKCRQDMPQSKNTNNSFSFPGLNIFNSFCMLFFILKSRASVQILLHFCR